MAVGATLVVTTFVVQLPSIHETEVTGGDGYTSPEQIACYLSGAGLFISGSVYGVVAFVRWALRTIPDP